MDAQTMGTIDYAYPGFDRAVATKSADGDQDLFGSNLRPDEDTGPVSRAAVGNNRFLIESLTRSGQTVIATLCNYRYGLAHQQGNGTFVSVLNKAVNDQGIDTLRVRLTAPPNESNNAFPPQAGPAPAPAVDVFGDWNITGRSTEFRTASSRFPQGMADPRGEPRDVHRESAGPTGTTRIPEKPRTPSHRLPHVSSQPWLAKQPNLSSSTHAMPIWMP